MSNLFQRAVAKVFRLQSVENSDLVKKVTIHVEETGSSGTEIFGGYYNEEYLAKLRGTPAMDLYDQMRRSDPKIKMVLSAVKNPIKSAQWKVQPGDVGEQYKLHAELIEQILFKDLEQSWQSQLAEILTHLDFGFSIFEVIHKVVLNHPKFGNYNSLAKLAWRNPRTIERWNLDSKTEKIKSVTQYAFGDLQKLVDIPGEYLLIFSHEKEGANFEGVSALRPCYGPWVRKNTFLKLLAIGMEKYAIPTPYMEVPEGKESSQQFINAKKVLEKYVAHQQQYITLPAGWKLGFSQTNFDAEKIRAAIQAENTEMANAFLENFLELGQSGSGSYALGSDLSDFFLTGIEHVANYICDVINRELIPDLVKTNYGPQSVYPQLVASGIKDKPGKEFAEILKIFSDGKIIIPDAELEDDMREKYKLPKRTQNDQRQVQAPQAPQFSDSAKRTLKLADKPATPKALISQETDVLRAFMQQSLGEMGSQVVADLMAKKKRANPSQYLKITSQVTPKGEIAYKQGLTDLLTQSAMQSLDQVRKEVPGGSKIRLVEKQNSLQLSDFDNLPTKIKALIQSQVGLLSKYQIADLLKGVYFQFDSSVTSTDSDAQLEADLTETVDKFVEGASVAASAGNTAARMVNESRSTFYFDEDVLENIESFTFVNGDPVSPICQDLAGTVFSKDDPNMDRYSPPLHHNCKSYLVANLKGSNKEIDDAGLKPSKSSLEKFITLSATGMIAMQAIDVSKTIAQTQEDARRFAQEYGARLDIASENEFNYRFEQFDPGQFEEGTLKTFSPMAGVIVYMGKLKTL